MYDLKDHPDFQYRPGTVVIRVANFTGEDANCTAGQVSIENNMRNNNIFTCFPLRDEECGAVT